MTNCLKWVCVFVVSAFTLAFMYVPKSNSSSLEDTQKTISALTALNCQGKFNDSNKYYAVCPNDTFIEISHLNITYSKLM